MKQLTLPVSERKESGSTAVRRLRRSGQIPAVVYGKSGVRSLQVNRADFHNIWRVTSDGAALIEIHDKAGGKVLTVIQEIQRNPITDAFLHIDFHEVSTDEKLTISVPIHLTGEAVGVKNEGGILEVHLHDVEISCFPRDLPDCIELEVTELRIGESLHISHLPTLQNVTYTSAPEATIVSCLSPRVAVTEDEEQEEPEEDVEGTSKATDVDAEENSDKKE